MNKNLWKLIIIHCVLSIRLYSQNFISGLENEASRLTEILKKEYRLEYKI